MKITDIEELKNMARTIRKGIIEQVYSANSGHPGGSLSIADILTVLYFNELNIDEKNPKWEDRDRMILSKGHCSPALYSCLANRGFFDKEELNNIYFTSKNKIEVDALLERINITESEDLFNELKEF